MAIKTEHLELVKPEMTDEIESSIGNFQDNADTIDSSVKALEDEDKRLQSEIDDANDDISSLQSKTKSNEDSIKENEKGISDNKSAIETNSSNISTNTSDIDTLKKDVETKSNKSDVDKVIQEYGTNEYKDGTKADKYDSKPSVAIMEVSGESSFPHDYGTLLTSWSADDQAMQIFVDSDHKVWTREVHTNSYPDWSEWREMEDVNGAQEKADTAESSAKSYTDSEVSSLKERIDELESRIEELEGGGS